MVDKQINEITGSTRIAEAVTSSLGMAAVFDKHNIDYGNFGWMTVNEAAMLANYDPDKLLKELREHITEVSLCKLIKSWEPVFLCEFITANHHFRMKKLLPRLTRSCKQAERLKKVSKESSKMLSMFAEDLLSHINKEQRMLFPYIRKISDPEISGHGIQVAPFGKISNPVKSLMAEHLSLSQRIQEIKEGIDRPVGSKTEKGEISGLTAILREVESLLKLCIHFENNLLFPKAVALEKKIMRSNKNIIKNKTKTT